MSKEKDVQVIIDFSNAVNNYNFDMKSFIEQFKREHRTLQQSMFRAMLGIIVAMSKDDYHVDGRNEYSKETAILLVQGYAEMKKQEYLKQNGTDEFYQKRAEELKQHILREPEMFFNLPLI